MFCSGIGWLVAGTSGVDLRVGLDALGERGLRSVLAEGGPSLNGQLVAAGLLDELCLTVSPMLVGGESKRIAAGAPPASPQPMVLRSLCQDDDYLFLRFRATRSS